MIKNNDRLGIKIKSILYDLSDIIDIYYDGEDLNIEFNGKEKDYFTMNKQDADYYIELYKSTFDKIYE